MFRNRMPRYEVLSEEAMATLDGGWRRLVSEIGGDVNILAGTIEEIAGEPFGTLVVAYPAAPEILERANRFYAATGLSTEVLGYVA